MWIGYFNIKECNSVYIFYTVPLPPFPTPPFFKEPPMIEEVVPFDVGTPVKRKRRGK